MFSQSSSPRTSLLVYLAVVLTIIAANVAVVTAQSKTTGIVKGKVRVESGAGASAVRITVRQDEREVSTATTNSKGDFTIADLPPGVYKLEFRKQGLSTGSIANIKVEAGKTNQLRDRLVLPIDEGSIASLRGSVFNEAGRSVSGVTVQIARINPDGSIRKFDETISNGIGEFAFRLAPTPARYRVTAKASGVPAVSKDVEVESAVIYRVSLTLRRESAANSH